MATAQERADFQRTKRAIKRVGEIEAAAQRVTRDLGHYGFFRLQPAVKLRDRRNGEVVYATMVCNGGMFPGCVFLKGKEGWWLAEPFEVCKE